MIVASFFAPRFDRFGCDYDELLFLLDKSCKKLNLEHFVISDSLRPKPLNTFLVNLPENLMQAFFYGQIKFMKESKDTILFTGADCLLTKRMGLNFDSLPDIAITTSDDAYLGCRLNTGAVWVRSLEKCIDVWKVALEKKPEEWGEDQICLRDAISESNLNVLELRCEDHNGAPENIEDDIGMPTVVHFRGNRRKKLMKDWAKKHLGIE